MIDLIIIGGGPTGLACAIEAKKAGLNYLILEKGGITDAIRRFPINMTFFSTPELLEIDEIPFTITNQRPSRIEALQYYRHVVRYHKLTIKLHTTVTQVMKYDSTHGFVIRTDKYDIFESKFLIIATGYFDFTNRLNVEGEDLSHVFHYYNEPYAYVGCNVVVIGGRNSAVETALDLFRHGAKVTIVHRGSELGSVKYWIKPDIDNRIKNKEINVYFNTRVKSIAHKSIELIHQNDQICLENSFLIPVDFVFALIGYRPDEALLRGPGIQLNSDNLIPSYDPLTFESNIPNLYLAGSVACGCETWNIFIENGRTHAQPIINDISRKLTVV